MTEQQWERTSQAHLMWPVLTASRKRAAAQARKRRFRLIACAFCRNAWDLLIDERSRRAIEVAELFADERASAGDLEAAKSQAWAAYCEGVARRRETSPENDRLEANRALAEHAAGWVANKDASEASRQTAGDLGWIRYHSTDLTRIWRTCDLIREIFGNPFRPLTLDPGLARWNGGAAVRFSQEMYESRDFSQAPLLADMLEDAGCTDTQVLTHLRGSGPHVRGCCAVDAVLGKS